MLVTVISVLFSLTLAAVEPPARVPEPKREPEPTADEVRLLWLVNRLRADPAGEATRLAPADADPVLPGIDLALFRQELGAMPAVAPLVMHPALVVAARRHAAYLIANGPGANAHREVRGAQGFTGVDAVERMNAAGFAAVSGGENVASRLHSVDQAHTGLVIDWDLDGKLPGGMQAGRGHRVNLMFPAYRQCGIGIAPSRAGLVVVQQFALRPGGRLAGGVVYLDANRNGEFDPGEGRGGVVISAPDGTRAVTWASGGWAMELATASTSALTLSARHGDRSVDWTLAPGSANAVFDWRLAADEDAAMARRLITQAESAKPGTRTRLIALVAIAETGFRLDVADDLKQRMHDLADATARTLADDRQAVRAAFTDDRAIEALLARCRAAWKDTAAAPWFDEVPTVRGAQTLFQTFVGHCARGPIPDAWHGQTRRRLLWSLNHVAVAEWRATVQRLIEALGEYRPVDGSAQTATADSQSSGLDFSAGMVSSPKPRPGAPAIPHP